MALAGNPATGRSRPSEERDVWGHGLVLGGAEGAAKVNGSDAEVVGSAKGHSALPTKVVDAQLEGEGKRRRRAQRRGHDRCGRRIQQPGQ